MKKLITTLLLLMIININAQTVIDHQRKAFTYPNGYIRMEIQVMKDNKLLDDSTEVIINVMNDKLTFIDKNSDFTLVLHPNKEYNITFKRKGCQTKSIFVTTANINYDKSYIIKTTINMLNGDSNSFIYSGKIYFNSTLNNFEAKITGIKLKKESYNLALKQ